MGITAALPDRSTTESRRNRRPRQRGQASVVVALLVALLALTAAACTSAGDEDASTDAPAAAEAPDDMDHDAADRSGTDFFAAGDDAEPGSDVRSAGAGFDLGSIGRQVIVEMDVTMTSDDVRGTVDAVLRSAAALGGGVASSDVDYGERPGHERAVLTVKVPAGSLQSFLGGLDRLGTVVSLNQGAQDVTDQLTDLGVRISNAERSVERVRALLTEAETLGEVIELESELTRRQTDLERLQATERNLTDRVALSTVTLQVFPTAAPEVEPEPDADDGLADAFRTGLDAFASVLFGIAFVLAVLAPFLVVAAVVLLVAWVVVVRIRSGARTGRRPNEPESAVDGSTDGPVSEPVGATAASTPVE